MREFLGPFIILVIAIIPVEVSAVNRIAIPEGTHYFRSAATISGPEALWVNPAALGDYRDITVQWIGEYRERRYGRDWAFNITGEGLGIGYRHLGAFEDHDYDEYIIAVGEKLGHGVFWGGSYRYVKDGPGLYDKRHFWNIGFLFRQNPRFMLGLSLSNLNRGKVDGERSDIEQLYSLGIGMMDNLLLFSAEISLSSGQSLSSAEYSYSLDVFPARGITLYGCFRKADTFEIGLRFNVGSYFIGGQGRFESGAGHRGTSTFIGYTRNPESSVIAGR